MTVDEELAEKLEKVAGLLRSNKLSASLAADYLERSFRDTPSLGLSFFKKLHAMGRDRA